MIENNKEIWSKFWVKVSLFILMILKWVYININ